MASREIMRGTTQDLKKYYNPQLNGELRMDTNTNVLGPNPAVIKFLRESELNTDGYPGTYSDGLRKALADLYGLDMENFVAGCGSDEMLDVAFKAFTEAGDVCTMPYPSYSLYGYFAKINGCGMQEVDLDEGFQLDVDGIVRNNSKVTVIPSPNNPTGNSFREDDLEEVLTSLDGIVIMDEAYGEYSNHSMIPKVNEFDNLIVLRTFSKAYAMAGLRVGYAVSNLDIADMMNSVRIPYSLNSIGEGAAIAAVKSQGFIEESRRMVSAERPKLASELKRIGFEPYASDANFILARSPIDHERMVDGLKEKGILIRDFGSKRRTENCVRVTVGTNELNRRMVDAMEEVLG